MIRKSREKKVSGKKSERKKIPNFLKSLEKMSLEIKSCVLDSWDFFPKIVWGAASKNSENKITGNKVLQKIYPKKKKPIKKF